MKNTISSLESIICAVVLLGTVSPVWAAGPETSQTCKGALKDSYFFGRLKHTEKLLDPAFNLKIGSLYFSTLLKKYDEDAELALAAYNAGPRRVDDWLKRYPVRN